MKRILRAMLLKFRGSTKILLLLVTLCLSFASIAAAQKRPITLDDFSKIVAISGPQISHNGARIGVVISRVNLKDDRHDTQLVLIDVKTGAQQPLTFDRLGVGNPRWSPQDDRIAFTAEAETGKDKAKKAQVFVLSTSGGEAHKITDAPQGVEQP